MRRKTIFLHRVILKTQNRTKQVISHSLRVNPEKALLIEELIARFSPFEFQLPLRVSGPVRSAVTSNSHQVLKLNNHDVLYSFKRTVLSWQCPRSGKNLVMTSCFAASAALPAPGSTPQWRLSLPQARGSVWRLSLPLQGRLSQAACHGEPGCHGAGHG